MVVSSNLQHIHSQSWNPSPCCRQSGPPCWKGYTSNPDSFQRPLSWISRSLSSGAAQRGAAQRVADSIVFSLFMWRNRIKTVATSRVAGWDYRPYCSARYRGSDVIVLSCDFFRSSYVGTSRIFPPLLAVLRTVPRSALRCTSPSEPFYIGYDSPRLSWKYLTSRYVRRYRREVSLAHAANTRMRIRGNRGSSERHAEWGCLRIFENESNHWYFLDSEERGALPDWLSLFWLFRTRCYFCHLNPTHRQ